MRTDTKLIESYLEGRLCGQELSTFLARKNAEPGLRQNIMLQARVHMAALIFGRRKRQAQIIKAGEKAFADPQFSETITAIFR